MSEGEAPARPRYVSMTPSCTAILNFDMSLDGEGFVPVRIERVILPQTANKVTGRVDGSVNDALYTRSTEEEAIIFVVSPTEVEQATS